MIPRLSRPSKVTRTNVPSSSRRRRSLTSAALEEVENYIHTNSTDIGSGNIVTRPSSPFSSIDGGDGSHESDEYNGGNEYNIADAFNSDDGYNSGNGYRAADVFNGSNAFSSATAFNNAHAFNIANSFGTSNDLNGAQEPRTAADIACERYGEDVKIDSALCRKVAVEIAHRLPLQRREHQKLNMERRSNLEALLCHMTGQQVVNPCKNCRKGHGPWQQCVVYDGQMCGSCTNCWYNASGSRCTFHCNAAVAAAAVRSPPYPITIPNGPLTGISAGYDRNRINPPYYSPLSETGLKREWGLEIGLSSQCQPSLLTPTPARSFNLAKFHPLFTSQVAPALYQALTGNAAGTPLLDETGNPTNSQPSQLLVTAMNQASQLSPLERHFARMESGAEELALRIAEFNDYVRTPEGLAEYNSSLAATEGAFLLQAGGEMDQSPSAGVEESRQNSPIFDDGPFASPD